MKVGRNMYDVAIIGAGVIGVAVARELSRYQLQVCVIEKEEDVGCGTSKANSGIVHSGYDAPNGTWKAKLNVQGNKRMEELSKELDFPFYRNGSLVICFQEEERIQLQMLYENGVKNGVEGLRILSKEEVHDMEPHIRSEVISALYAPSGGIVCPFGLTIALAENAFVNGVEFCLSTEVQHITKLINGYELTTPKGNIQSRYVVNAGGVYADKFHNMVSKHSIHITPRRGDYYLLDKAEGGLVTRTIFQLPNPYGKGVLIAPTTHGNVLIGPTAIDIADKEATNITQDGYELLLEKATKTLNTLPLKQVITSFAGLRAHEDQGEFIIGEPEDAKGFIDCAGIESPGLSCAPVIGEYVVGILKDSMKLENKEIFIEKRTGILNPRDLTKEEWAELVRSNPAYGTIICRCEMVTEGEILDAIHRPLGAKSLDGIKRRTRAGMGRCQSGFCLPKVLEILARELKIHHMEVKKSGRGSYILVDNCKESMGGV